MADERGRPALSPRDRRDPAAPSSPRWRVTPAPDGRGGQPPTGQQPKGPSPRWIVAILIVGLLALNLWISSQALKPNPRVQIPYSPTFIPSTSQRTAGG